MKKPNRRSKRTSVTDSSSLPEGGSSQQRQHHEEKDLEKEDKALKDDIGTVQKVKKDDHKKLRVVEEQVTEMKKKVITQSHASTRRQRTCETGRFDEIQRLKAQKVQLLCKLKLESVQFRLSRASMEKEILQLKKEKRRNEYEIHKLRTLNQRQKQVLQRKTEEASLATKRLNDLLQFRRGAKIGNILGIQGFELELKVAARVEEIRSDYERQMEEMAEEVRKFEEEAEMLKQEKFGFLLRDKEVDCSARDSELRDLQEEVLKLSNLVSQLRIRKVQDVHLKNPQVDTNRSSISVGSGIKVFEINASGSETSGSNVAATEKSALGTCCSCSKKSLCKTTKCECRAAMGSCGPHCGCVSSKCTNREILIKADDSPELAVAQNLPQLCTSELGKRMICSQTIELENDHQPQRKPLCEIGNTQINSSHVKTGKKTRRLRTAAQLDSVLPPCSLSEKVNGNGKAVKIPPADVAVKLKRATRSVNNP